MFGNQTDGKIGGSRKKKDTEEDKITGGREEGDFVDEKELKGALQLGVLKTGDAIALRVGDRNGMDMEFNEEVVSQVAAMVWDTVADDWADDLARFSAHGGRQKVNLDDIALLTRRNPDLLQAACKTAGVEYNEPNGQKSGKGRKRKKEEVPPAVFSEKPISEEDVAVLDDRTLHTPKSYLKKPKLQSEEPIRKRVTSTPKTAERTLKFPDEITPIRPTDKDASFSSNHVNLSAIEEERTFEENNIMDEVEEDQNDSFDVFRVTPDSTKTITNTTSVLKQAEEHTSVVENTNLENERLEGMMPTEEFENASVDSFDNFKSNDDEPMNESVGTPKNAVFSNKMSSFAFDDDDSFDDPIVDEPKKTPTCTKKASTKDKTKEVSTPKTAPTPKRNKTLQLDHDSFDEFDFDI